MPGAAILAGGRARRFGGRDKGALLVNGRTILEHLLEALRPITTDILIVGRNPGELQGIVAPVRTVPDRLADRGPLGGLDTALGEATDRVVLVLACDMPFVTTPLLERLAALADDADAVVPRTSEGDHPLCAAYTRACHGTVRRQLDAGRLALRDLLSALHLRRMTEAELQPFGDPRRLLANINTPGEYASLAEPHAGHSR